MSVNDSRNTISQDKSILSTDDLKECEVMREWITNTNKHIEQYHQILYISVTTILAYSFTTKTFITCLIPYSIIIPLFYMEQKKHESICMMGAYIMVFGKELHWEMRHVLFEENIPMNGKRVGFVLRRGLKYYMVSFLCSFAALIKLLYSEDFTDNLDYKWKYGVLILLGTGLIMWLFCKYSFNYQSHRREMFATWSYIYANERNIIVDWYKDINSIIKEKYIDKKSDKKEYITPLLSGIIIVLLLVVILFEVKMRFSKDWTPPEEPPLKVQIVDGESSSNEGATVGATISLP